MTYTACLASTLVACPRRHFPARVAIIACLLGAFSLRHHPTRLALINLIYEEHSLLSHCTSSLKPVVLSGPGDTPAYLHPQHHASHPHTQDHHRIQRC